MAYSPGGRFLFKNIFLGIKYLLVELGGLVRWILKGCKRKIGDFSIEEERGKSFGVGLFVFCSVVIIVILFNKA